MFKSFSAQFAFSFDTQQILKYSLVFFSQQKINYCTLFSFNSFTNLSTQILALPEQLDNLYSFVFDTLCSQFHCKSTLQIRLTSDSFPSSNSLQNSAQFLALPAGIRSDFVSSIIFWLCQHTTSENQIVLQVFSPTPSRNQDGVLPAGGWS